MYIRSGVFVFGGRHSCAVVSTVAYSKKVRGWNLGFGLSVCCLHDSPMRGFFPGNFGFLPQSKEMLVR